MTKSVENLVSKEVLSLVSEKTELHEKCLSFFNSTNNFEFMQVLTISFINKMQKFTPKMFHKNGSWSRYNKLLTASTNRIAHIRHQCWKTTVLSSHGCLINTGVGKINNT